jgi:hypothetical protein
MTSEQQPKDAPLYFGDRDVSDSFGSLQKKVLRGLSTASAEKPMTVWQLCEIISAEEGNRNAHTVRSKVEGTLHRGENGPFQAKLAEFGLRIAHRNMERMGTTRGYYLAPIKKDTSGESS